MRLRVSRVALAIVALIVALAVVLLLHTDVTAPPRPSADNASASDVAAPGNTAAANLPVTDRAPGSQPGNQPATPPDSPSDPGPGKPPGPAHPADPLPGVKVSARLRVRVNFAEGGPAAGALVRIHALQVSDYGAPDWQRLPAWQIHDAGRTDGSGELVATLDLATDQDDRRMVKASAELDGFAASFSGEVTLTPHDPSPLLIVTMQRGVAVTGRVVDGSGNPIAGASVQLFLTLVSQARAHAIATSGTDGRFDFNNVPQTTALLEVRAQGFALWRQWDRRFEPTVPSHYVGDIVLLAAGGLRGRVIGPDGKGVPRAGVHLRKVPTDFLAPEDFTTTDDEGRFHFSTVYGGAGRFLLVARAPGFSQGVLPEVAVRAGQITDVGDVRLQTGIALRVSVTGPDGAPVVGARLRAVFDGEHAGVGSLWQNRQFRATSDERGLGVIRPVYPGPWRLAVYAPGFARHVAELEISGSLDHTVRLAQGGSVSGRLTLNNAPEADAQVGLLAHGHWLYELHTAGDTPLRRNDWGRSAARPPVRTDTEGRFLVTDLLPGMYLLLAWDSEGKHLLLHDHVEVKPAQTTDVGTLSFATPGALRVEVLEDGQPRPNLEIRIEGGGERRHVNTDAAGVADFGALAAGDYELWLAGERIDRDLPHLAARRVRVDGDTRHVLNLPGDCVRLFGRFTLGGAPLTGGMMLIGTGLTLQTPLNDRGEYSFACVPPGEYTLRGGGGWAHTLRIEAGGPVEFSRDLAGAAVTGRVIGANGSPVAATTVFLQRRGAGVLPHHIERAHTGDDGTFRFVPVWADTWRVGVGTPGGAAQLDFTHEGPPVSGLELKLAPAGTLALEIKPRGLASFSSHVVRLRDAGGDYIAAHTSVMPTAGAKAEITGVPPGTYTVELYGTGYACAFLRGVKIAAGQRQQIEVDLPAAATARLTFSGESLVPADVAQASVTWLDGAGNVVTLPWPYGRDRQRGPLMLEVADLFPDVKQLRVHVPGYAEALVPIEFAPGAKLNLDVALTR